MICPECNTMNPNSIKKCIKCGAKLEKGGGGGAGSSGPRLKKKEKPEKAPKAVKTKQPKTPGEEGKSRIPMLIILLVLTGAAYFLYLKKDYVMDYYNHLIAVSDTTAVDSVEKNVDLYNPQKGRSKRPDSLLYQSLSDAKKAQQNKKKRTFNEKVYYGKDNKKMVLIKGHTFKMGSDKGSDLEKPAHKARVIDYYMDETEVTNAQFKKFLKESGYKPEKGSLSHLRDRRFNKDDQPVVDVSYNDAVAYAKWAEKRLPTEIEWECAAKDTANYPYPTGKDLKDDEARFGMNVSVGTTVSVKSYKPNSYGVYDLAGNASEWVHGVIFQYPGNEDFNRNYGKTRVPRGGSWMSPKEDCKSYRRAILDISQGTHNIGFRCVISKIEIEDLINK